MALHAASESHRMAMAFAQEAECVKLNALLTARRARDAKQQLKRVVRAFGVASLRRGWATWRDAVVHYLVAEVQAKVSCNRRARLTL
jgi:hypothetical protein